MRILQVINSLGTGGAEKLLLDTIPKYRDRGIIMDLLVLDGSEHPFLKALKDQDCCTIYSFGNGTVYNPRHIFRLRKFLKKYDLMHVHLFPALYWVGFAKWFSSVKTPIIFTEHNTTNRRRSHFFLKQVDRFIYPKYHHIITIAEEVDSNLKKHLNLPESRFTLIRNGIDINGIQQARPYSSKELNIPIGSKLLMQVSSFTPQKDHATLINALPQLAKNVMLLLVGDGPTRAACEQLVTDLKLRDRVHFLGLRTDVPRLMKSVDIMLLSTHYEGLSLASMEAMASGKPLVAAAAPGVVPVVQKAGLLFPVGDYKSLGQIIAELIASEKLYNQTVANCLERAAQFDMETMIDQHLELYKRYA